MMNRNPLCRKLLVSWGLVGVGLLLMARFGQPGLLMAIVPIAFAQNLRLEHDRAAFERLYDNRIWTSFALLYYLVLSVVTIVSLMRDIRLDDLPIVSFIIMMMFPIIVGMIVSDLNVCLRSGKKGQDDSA